jgi:hypothetical protein
MCQSLSTSPSATSPLATKKIPTWKIRKNVISHAYDVGLKPFKLHWDREDETNVRDHFQEILSTLSF